MKKTLIVISALIVVFFAMVGVVVIAVYVGMQYGVFNVQGSIIQRNASFGPVPTTTPSLPDSNGCDAEFSQTVPCAWSQTTQWDVVKGGLKKDASIIDKVSTQTDIAPRMIAAAVIPEQIRFFADDNNREVFKRYFEPLKLLVSLSKFSLGISGIKQDTANAIEQYANDPSSPFYPGPEIAPLLAYPAGVDHDKTLFDRLTNEKDHYYSYLYTAVYLKEIESQWQKAGYDVSARPDVLVTLFNLGFTASQPKANPQVAGATIIIGGQSYSFGYLGTLFYESDELNDILPQ